MYKIGLGKDVHKFEEGQKLILGGVEIPYDRGLAGHSDADVLTHAIIDAMLGALALGDIGKHFPDTDPEYKDISSIKLLNHVNKLVNDNGWEIGNIDTVLVLQEPKIGKHRENIQNTLANELNIDKDCVSIKATTSEWLGFEGRGEGVSCEAIVMLRKIN